MLVRCPNPATVLQQRTHLSLLRSLASGTASTARQRRLCVDHADIIDKDWIDTTALDRTPTQTDGTVWLCEWVEEESDK